MADGEHWAPVDGITAEGTCVVSPLKTNSITTLVIPCRMKNN